MAELGQNVYFVASLSTLSVPIVVSNVFVCSLVCFNKAPRTYPNWLIVSLAVSDILTGAFLLPVLLIKLSSVVPSYLIAVILLSGVANPCSVTNTETTRKIHKAYLVCLQFFGVVVPYVFITAAYIRIFRQVRQSVAMKRDFESPRVNKNERRRISSDAKVAKVFCIVSAAFILCWLPIIYMTTANTVLNRPDIIPDVLSTVSLFCMAASS